MWHWSCKLRRRKKAFGSVGCYAQLLGWNIVQEKQARLTLEVRYLTLSQPQTDVWGWSERCTCVQLQEAYTDIVWCARGKGSVYYRLMRLWGNSFNYVNNV